MSNYIKRYITESIHSILQEKLSDLKPVSTSEFENSAEFSPTENRANHKVAAAQHAKLAQLHKDKGDHEGEKHHSFAATLHKAASDSHGKLAKIAPDNRNVKSHKNTADSDTYDAEAASIKANNHTFGSNYRD